MGRCKIVDMIKNKTRPELAKLLGPHLTMAGREQFRAFLGGEPLFLRYEHVRSWVNFTTLLASNKLEFSDGAEGVEIHHERSTT